MSNKIDLKHYENKYTFETPADPNWKGEPWTTADLKVILDELKRCYEEIDEVTKWKDHWKRTSQTWSKVVEIFDPKANNAELNDAINKAFGHDASE